MSAHTPPICEAMTATVDLAQRLGISHINKLPGCWEHRVDDAWSISLNGHREPTLNSQGIEVPPFSVYVEFNGLPAGVFNAFGGTIAAGAVANERTFIAALKRAKEG